MNANTSLVEISAAEQRLAARVDTSVTGQLEVSGAAGGLGFRNAAEAMEFAKLMSLSHIAVPKHLRGNPGACLAVTIQAIEWRLSPYAVANKSYSVNDRLAYESQLIQAVILQRAPIKGRFRFEYAGQGDQRVCTVSATLTDGEVVTYSSPPFGRIQPKNSPLWKSDPDQQQAYFSGRALCRRHFPDVLLGVYDRDEIEPDPGRARDVTPAPRALSARLDALAQTVPAETAEPAEDTGEADQGGAHEVTETTGEAAGMELAPAATYTEPDWIALGTGRADEYIDAAEAHILATSDADTLDAWWRAGKQIRTRLGVSVDDAAALADKLKARVAGLRGGTK